MDSTENFRPDACRGQFVIGREASPHLAGVPHHAIRLDAFEIRAFEGMPAFAVADASGATIGAFLGHPVDLAEGRVLAGPLALDAALGADVDGFIEERIYRRLSGSFLFVLDHGGHRRVYLDASGTTSAVYDPQAGRVAATTPLLLDPKEYRARFDTELHDFLRVPRDGWFPGGLTAHLGIHRIQCNHYLDLDTWQQHRHWPRGPIPQARNPEDACRVVAEATLDTIKALRASGTVALALTGGNESRLMLALCRDVVKDMDFVTIANREQRVDMALVRQLVDRFDLPHRFLPGLVATPEEVEAYVLRAGHCMGDARAQAFPSVAPLAGVDYFVNGYGGEVARGFFWRGGDTAETPLDARGITTRLGMPVHPKVVEAVGRWLEGVDGLDSFMKLDLAYLELRLAPWAFANAYGTPEVCHIHPMVSRRAFEAMASLPPDWRRSGRLIGAIIEMYWPELLTIHINRYGDYRDLVQLVRRVATHPSQIMRKLRRKLA